MGRPKLYSDLAIETALTLRLLFKLPLRQTEGFLKSIFRMMNVGLNVPDHTTLSRRNSTLKTTLKRIGKPRGRIDLIIANYLSDDRKTDGKLSPNLIHQVGRRD